MTDCCSRSGHQHCLSLLRAPLGSDQQIVGPAWRARNFHLLALWSAVWPLSEVKWNPDHYLIQVTSHLLPLAFFCLQLRQRLSELGFQLERNQTFRYFALLTWPLSPASTFSEHIQILLPTLTTLNSSTFAQISFFSLGLLRQCSNQK